MGIKQGMGIKLMQNNTLFCVILFVVSKDAQKRQLSHIYLPDQFVKCYVDLLLIFKGAFRHNNLSVDSARASLVRKQRVNASRFTKSGEKSVAKQTFF